VFNVTIIIFGDFRQFSAKKIGAFIENQGYSPFLKKPAVLCVKTPMFFSQFFSENTYFKNHNIGPRTGDHSMYYAFCLTLGTLSEEYSLVARRRK
jgi:hypothetical protein